MPWQLPSILQHIQWRDKLQDDVYIITAFPHPTGVQCIKKKRSVVEVNGSWYPTQLSNVLYGIGHAVSRVGVSGEGLIHAPCTVSRQSPREGSPDLRAGLTSSCPVLCEGAPWRAKDALTERERGRHCSPTPFLYHSLEMSLHVTCCCL